MSMPRIAMWLPSRFPRLAHCAIAPLFVLLSFQAYAQVPQECVEAYYNGGAIPGTPSCRFVAPAVSVDLSTRYCVSTGSGPWIQEYCGTICTDTSSLSAILQCFFPSSPPFPVLGDRNQGPPPCAGGNPVNILTGNKYQEEKIFESDRTSNLKVSMFYNSASGIWRLPFSHTVFIDQNDSQIAYVRRETGQRFTFIANANQWVADSDVSLELTQLPSNAGWQVRDTEDNVELYNDQGRLVSITSVTGQEITLSYNVSGTVETITINSVQSAETLSVAQDVSDMSAPQIETLQDPDGNIYTFSYNSDGMLEQITYPNETANTDDDPFRIFHYEDAQFPEALTGITDERGVRYASWAYDDNRRAISSEHASNGSTIDLVQFDYQHIDDVNDPRVTVTNSLEQNTVYRFVEINGARKVSSVERQGWSHPSEAGVSCLAADQYTTYDANGYPDLKVDWEGKAIDYDYDTRGLETQRVEGLQADISANPISTTPSAVSRTVQTYWHPNYRLPTISRVRYNFRF